MTHSWMATLDAFECHLNDQVELVEGGRHDEIVAFAPPPGLPAMPRPLVTRASELLSRAQALTEQVTAIRDDTALAMVQARHPAFARHPVPVYVDHQA